MNSNTESKSSLAELDQHWMAQAIQLAEESLYITSPNPRVGCLIVHDNQLIGAGSTQSAGSDHAEIQAIKDAVQRGHESLLAGATVYVTLEPCSHYGRTPPCVNALIERQVGRVVVAMRDPNPLVAGRGLALLEEAGVAVLCDVLKEEALALNPGFVSRMIGRGPWVRTKVASSLDAKVALASGESKWITETAARADGQHWRARSCLVLTGIGTVEADDPLLNVRDFETARQPIRAVIDRTFRIDEQAAIFNGDSVWVFIEDRPLSTTELAKKHYLEHECATRVIAMPLAERTTAELPHLDLVAIMRYLAEQEINEVHLEAGPGLNTAFMEAGLIDELLLYIAPKIIGPGREAFALEPLANLSEARQLRFIEQQLVGSDVRLRAHEPTRWQQLLAALEEN